MNNRGLKRNRAIRDQDQDQDYEGQEAYLLSPPPANRPKIMVEEQKDDLEEKEPISEWLPIQDGHQTFGKVFELEEEQKWDAEEIETSSKCSTMHTIRELYDDSDSEADDTLNADDDSGLSSDSDKNSQSDDDKYVGIGVAHDSGYENDSDDDEPKAKCTEQPLLSNAPLVRTLFVRTRMLKSKDYDNLTSLIKGIQLSP